jgi:hypothetical protein
MDPFRKVGWSFHYKKLGGASQLDMGRFWSMYADANDTSVGTYWWDLDGQNFHTGTLTFTAGYQWFDRIPLPPGARARLFEFRLLVPDTIKVENVNIDLAQEGIKGLTRRGQQGTPADMNS